MKIGKRGAGLAFRIPVKLVREFYIQAGDEIDMSVGDGRIIIQLKAGRRNPSSPPA